MAATRVALFPPRTQPSLATAIATWAAMTSAPTILAPGMTAAVAWAVAAETIGASRPQAFRNSRDSPFGRLSKAPFLLMPGVTTQLTLFLGSPMGCARLKLTQI